MDFYEIKEDAIVSPGEYVLYVPHNKIVLCGAFNRAKDFMRVLDNGHLVEDKIHNFKKIKLSIAEHREGKSSRCKGCRAAQ